MANSLQHLRLKAVLCGAIDDFRNALAAYSQLDAESTVNERRSVRSGVVDAAASMQEAETTLKDARIAESETAYASLDTTVSVISGRETLGEAATQIGTGSVTYKRFANSSTAFSTVSHISLGSVPSG